MLRNKAFLIGVLFILLTATTSVGSVSAQDGSEDGGIVVDDEFLSENATIDTVAADSGTVRIGDIQWDGSEEELTFKISNRNRITSVSIIDQAGVVGASGFQTIPATNVQLGPGETVKMTIEATNDVDYGQVITVSHGNQVITLTNEEPESGNRLREIGGGTWLAGGGLAFITTGLAGRSKLKKVNKDVKRVA